MRAFNHVLIALFLYAFAAWPVCSEAAEFKLWSVEPAHEKIASKTVNIRKAQYSPQGILDFVYRDAKGFKPKVILIKNKVAYINIEGDSAAITDRSGTTGAWYFTATVVFNLTEFKNIDTIYFVDEGEHFSYGLSSRLDYWSLMPLEEKRKYKAYIEDQKLNTKHEDVARYVEYLKDIGDAATVKELDDLKTQMKHDFAPCSITKTDFEKLVDETVNIIMKKK